MPKADFTPFLSRPLRQTKNAEIPIKIYRIVQTGPNTQFGGLSAGFAKLLYQLAIEDILRKEPLPPTSNGITTEIINLTGLFNFIFLKLF